MKRETTAIFTLLVDNEFGVLTRITALIRRAGWNIRSLAVAETAKAEISRLTICLECRHNTLEHVLERLGRLDCVKEITVFSPEDQLSQELALMTVSCQEEAAVQALCRRTGAAVLEQNRDSYILSLSCEPAKLDELLPEFIQCGLVELARSGAISLPRVARKEVPNER